MEMERCLSQECLFCKHEDLGLVPNTHVRKPSVEWKHLIFLDWGSKDKRTSRGWWPTCLAESAASGSVKHSVSVHKLENNLGKHLTLISGFYMHAHTCTPWPLDSTHIHVPLANVTMYVLHPSPHTKSYCRKSCLGGIMECTLNLPKQNAWFCPKPCFSFSMYL